MHQVGETTLDLEDRWFCPEWRDLIHKPREVCNLGLSRGSFCSGVEQINTEYCVCPLELYSHDAEEAAPSTLCLTGYFLLQIMQSSRCHSTLIVGLTLLIGGGFAQEI